MHKIQIDFKSFYGKSVKIAVIDSGIDPHFRNESKIHIVGEKTIYDCRNIELTTSIQENVNDEIGHGTAVISIIHKMVPEAKFYVIKAFGNDKFEIEVDKLVRAVKYVVDNYDVDIVQISSGTVGAENEDLVKLQKYINKLWEKGCIIVSAFDNLGAISYPAAFENVIGVDLSVQCTSIYDYEYVEKSCVNVRGRGIAQTVHWLSDTTRQVVGSSFACSYITGIISKFLDSGADRSLALQMLKEYSKKIISGTKYRPTMKPETIKRAIAFPFNKEMHSLVTHNDQLICELSGIYTTKYNRDIGRSAFEILGRSIGTNYIIENIEKVKWEDDFDTVIIGHCRELSEITRFSFKKYLIEKCIEHRKNAYCFDEYEITDEHRERFHKNDRMLFVPSYKKYNILTNRFSRLKVISVPVIMVCGTSSIQGKFNLQLALKKLFCSEGFRVGHLGTEPTSLLFGCNEIFPIGYGANVDVKGIDAVLAVNQLLEKIENDNVDVIIVGSQSISAPPSVGNLSHIPCSQTELMFGSMPDAVILTVNPFDDVSYVKRTIQFIEGATFGHVISIALYPLRRDDAWSVFNNQFTTLPNKELTDIANRLGSSLGVPTYIQDEIGFKCIFEKLIDYFKDE